MKKYVQVIKYKESITYKQLQYFVQTRVKHKIQNLIDNTKVDIFKDKCYYDSLRTEISDIIFYEDLVYFKAVDNKPSLIKKAKESIIAKVCKEHNIAPSSEELFIYEIVSERYLDKVFIICVFTENSSLLKSFIYNRIEEICDNFSCFCNVKPIKSEDIIMYIQKLWWEFLPSSIQIQIESEDKNCVIKTNNTKVGKSTYTILYDFLEYTNAKMKLKMCWEK